MLTLLKSKGVHQMKKLVKALIFSVAVLGFAWAPTAAYACSSFSECSGGSCVVCFATTSPNGNCGYVCRLVY
jgi:hypothetical protein